ncbi:MAG: YkgJ family cysteine cluster protein [Breznakibacter sp.]|nr:YkgJ family cysteine cluster protein [Breznakibacter sp.]
MNEKNREFKEQYLTIREEIDDISTKLSEMYATKMQCKAGCSSCCESITVFEVEFDAIQEQITKHKINLPKPLFLQRFTKRCRFLVNNRCSIYEYRPIICRTQGLPILYRSFNSDHYELSVCKLNFKGVKLNFFNDENALMMSPLNTKLLLLNHAYMKETAPSQKDLNKRRNLYELEG